MPNIFKRIMKKNNKYNFVDNIEEHDFIKLLKYDKRTEKIAESAMQDFIIPFPNFEMTDFSKKHNWNAENDKYGKSYQLYIHSLRFVSSLLLQYEKKQDINYLKKAEEFIESWIKFMNSKPKNEMIWYDHPVANRVQNIIHFLYLAKGKLGIDEEKYYKVLRQHGEFLMDDTHYNYNNHALMMDRSLMILGNILDDYDLFSTGYRRSIETFWYSFSSQGSHLENSPDYHRMVLLMYSEIEKYLKKHNQTFGVTINHYLELAMQFLPIIARPDKRMPALGDSGNSALGRVKKYKNFSDAELGLTITQREKPETFYVSFIAGYSSITHKHRDDLSLTLYYAGDDILVDSGKFNYGKDIRRRYVMSPQAHSTLFFDNEDYKLEKENRFTRKVKTSKYFDNKEYTLVKGENNSFDNSNLSRILITLKNYPVVILLDEAASSNASVVYQNFNLSPKSQIEHYELDSAVIKTKSGKKAQFIQLGQISEKIDITPSQTEPVQAIVTSGYGKAVENKQLRFAAELNKEEKYTFKTIINMDDSLNIQIKEINDYAILVSVNEEEIFINI